MLLIEAKTLQLLVYSQFLIFVKTYTFTKMKSSYIKYEQWDVTELGALTFKFKTHNHYGLIFYSDNSKSSSTEESFISLALNYGKLSLTVQMGAEDYRSKKSEDIGTDLNDLKWHYVEIKRKGRETTIKLDNNPNTEKILINDGEQSKLVLNSGLFFGGISPELIDNLVDGSILSVPR